MRRLLVTLLLALTLGAASAGVPFFVIGDSSFDRYTADPSTDDEQWMDAHYARMLAYSPYFDSRLAWFPNAWVYKDLYAIYVGSADATSHPDWILRDASGNRLYIPYACGDGTCPQYAADVGNPDFRAAWVGAARATLAAGYRGLFVDDVNLTLARVSDGNAEPVVPRDPRTAQPMTEGAWRGYMADFTAQIRSAFPAIEIVHNPLWFVGDADPSVQREIAAADWIMLERGVNDRGIVGGDGTYGFDTFLAHVDLIHRSGRSVAYAANARGQRQRAYGLAALLLLQNGDDMLANQQGGMPDQWWTGYDIGLGSPRGGRYAWAGVLRRDFDGGFVLVDPPGGPSLKVAFDTPCSDLRGHRRTGVSLRPASGAVFRCS